MFIFLIAIAHAIVPVVFGLVAGEKGARVGLIISCVLALVTGALIFTPIDVFAAFLGYGFILSRIEKHSNDDSPAFDAPIPIDSGPKGSHASVTKAHKAFVPKFSRSEKYQASQEKQPKKILLCPKFFKPKPQDSDMSSDIGGMKIFAGRRKVQKKEEVVYLPDTLFPVINADNVANKIKLLEEARESGKNNIPVTEQISRFGTAEMTIDTEIQRVITSYHTAAVHKIEQLDNRIDVDSQETKRMISEARLLPHHFNREVDEYFAKSSNEFNAVKNAYDLSKQEYEKFRADNKLERTANIVESRALGYSLMAGLVVLESAANAAFFADNRDDGLIGGFLIAVMASGFNVVSSAMTSYFGIRQINHVKRKAIGWVSFIAWSLALVNFAFAIGHFRDTGGLSIFPTHGNWFALQDPYSWLLFAVTLLCGLFASREGYKLDDPYPGYSDIAKKFYDAEDDFSDSIEERRNKLTEILNDYTGRIATVEKTVDNGLASVRKNIKDKGNTLVAYDRALRSAEKPYETLISMFRHENIKARTNSAPAYFMEETKLDLSTLPQIVTTSDDAEVAKELEYEVARLHQDIVGIHSEIVNAFNEYGAQIDLDKENRK